MDMLRYDAAFPADAGAVAQIGQNLSVQALGTETVEVRLGSSRRPTVARWRSFGWIVKV